MMAVKEVLNYIPLNIYVLYTITVKELLNITEYIFIIYSKGGMKLAESYSNVAYEDTLYEWGGPLFLRTDFDLTAVSGNPLSLIIYIYIYIYIYHYRYK